MDTPFLPRIVDITEEEHQADIATYGGLAESVRRLALATLQTRIPAEEVAQVRAQIDELSSQLEKDRIEGPFGVSLTSFGEVLDHGNAVVGVRNVVAVPLDIVQDNERGRADASFHLGPLYEGPPSCVHGGIVALLLDQISGEAASAAGVPGMTGTLTIRYQRPTPLGDCTASAWVDRIEGVKTIVKGEIRAADGEPTATCEGIFIIPRWVRDLIAQGHTQPPKFE